MRILLIASTVLLTACAHRYDATHEQNVASYNRLSQDQPSPYTHAEQRAALIEYVNSPSIADELKERDRARWQRQEEINIMYDTNRLLRKLSK